LIKQHSVFALAVDWVSVTADRGFASAARLGLSAQRANLCGYFAFALTNIASAGLVRVGREEIRYANNFILALASSVAHRTATGLQFELTGDLAKGWLGGFLNCGMI
jgi:hypothetical protein